MIDLIPLKLLFLTLEKKRYKIIKGGRGGAKSETIARSLLDLGMRNPLNILCTREYQISISKSVHRLLERLIITNKLTSFYRVYETKIVGINGTEFGFNGLQNIHNLKSIDQIDICWITEASTLSKHNANILFPSIRKEASEIWMDFNPEVDDDYVMKEFVNGKPDNYESKHTKLVTINWDENPFFPDVLELERQKCLEDNPEDYDHIWGGEIQTISESQIFKNRFIIKEFDRNPDPMTIEHNRLFQGVDYGFARDPSVMVRVFIKIEEGKRNLYISHGVSGVGVEVEELSDLFSVIPNAREWPSKADSARPELTSYLAKPYDERTDERGFDICSCEKWPGSVRDGIDYLRGFDNIFIHSELEEVAKEFRLYSWKVDKKSEKILPIPLDKNNHYMDGIRYSIDDYIKESKEQDLHYEDGDNEFNVKTRLNW